VRRRDISAERGEGVANLGYLEIRPLGYPGLEQILMGYEVAAFILHEVDDFRIVLDECLEVIVREVLCFQAGDFGFG